MTHVLEHCVNPITALENASRLIKPGGYLLLKVPNKDAKTVFHILEHSGLNQSATDAPRDQRRLSRYMRRWLVERFFAWLQWQRRILVRWEYHAQNFLGFVQLACLVVLFRRF